MGASNALLPPPPGVATRRCPILSAFCAERVGAPARRTPFYLHHPALPPGVAPSFPRSVRKGWEPLRRRTFFYLHHPALPHPFRVLCGKGGSPSSNALLPPPPGVAPSFPRSMRKGWEPLRVERSFTSTTRRCPILSAFCAERVGAPARRTLFYLHHPALPHPFRVLCGKGGSPCASNALLPPPPGVATRRCPILSAFCAERVGAPARRTLFYPHHPALPHPFRVLCGKGGNPCASNALLPPPPGVAPSFPRSVRKGWEPLRLERSFTSTTRRCPILSAFYAERVGTPARRTLFYLHHPALPHPFRVLCGKGGSPCIGFGGYGSNHVRLALIENEERTFQALHGIRQMLAKGAVPA